VSFAAITLCVASQRIVVVVVVYFVIDASGNFWTHPHMSYKEKVSTDTIKSISHSEQP